MFRTVENIGVAPLNVDICQYLARAPGHVVADSAIDLTKIARDVCDVSPDDSALTEASIA